MKKEEKLMTSKARGGETIATIYSGKNESEDFIVPDKLPTFLLYRRGASLNDGPIELDQQDLIKSFTTQPEKAINAKKFDRLLKEFLKKNLKSD